MFNFYIMDGSHQNRPHWCYIFFKIIEILDGTFSLQSPSILSGVGKAQQEHK